MTNKFSWTLLTTPPTKSGRYIVGHRGHSEIIHYLAPEEGPWAPNAKLGWQKNPRIYGATHYMPLPEITHEQSAEAKIDLFNRGMTRVDRAAFEESIRKNRPRFSQPEKLGRFWRLLLSATHTVKEYAR